MVLAGGAFIGHGIGSLVVNSVGSRFELGVKTLTGIPIWARQICGTALFALALE